MSRVSNVFRDESEVARLCSTLALEFSGIETWNVARCKTTDVEETEI
jgi:hypothetical protein